MRSGRSELVAVVLGCCGYDGSDFSRGYYPILALYHVDKLN